MTDTQASSVSRRRFLRGTGVAAAAAGLTAGSLPTAGASPAWRGRRSGGKSVAVLGGGMAGLAVAHELVERGFRVTVFEPTALGGKARSIPVPGTAEGGRKELPGEHGFRFFPGFYHNVPDTMRRIPFPGNANGVWDNLVAATEGKYPRANGRADATMFGMLPDPAGALTPDGLRRILVEEILKQQGVKPWEAEFFANRIVVFLTSSDERRFGQWEHVSWWDYVRAEQYSDEYRNVVAEGLTRQLVAAKADVASTRTIGNMAEAFIMNIMGRGNDGELDRVLNAPTNEAWIDPWVRLLRTLGVEFRLGEAVTALNVESGRIGSVRVRDEAGHTADFEADWFVCAMPVERARQLWSRDVLALDSSLAGTRELATEWMTGIQYYLREHIDYTHGHISFVDSQWAVTALTQDQFWQDRNFRADYGDGNVADCLSVDISDWNTPGMLFGKPASRCTADEIARETWAQMKAHLEDTGESWLPDEILHSWFLDPAIVWDPDRQRNTNETPLLINTTSSWEKRPTAHTGVPNLFLAGDFVRTDVDLATMESANESGRAAVNALLDAADSNAERVTVYDLYDPPEFEAVKATDAQLYRAGLPHALDRP
ncbi:Tat (twin-arginine translocation) pathway signal sequence [Haloechinothrix alba]|uniref:Tat (Twin-arginine translocation) pathway signal sequence n=1 Tax=Haloechinothrix alba TaxID=664784 RepID=A0A238Z2C1_9PSEU|nr:FAD-dependent oxidoreductase [Haloechinothrix alba]SNR76993.1 Tat (twin-arginine translocation) pathway signal sequence [Haloechinothrix alba]